LFNCSGVKYYFKKAAMSKREDQQRTIRAQGTSTDSCTQ
jgi:hypothetical protein